MSGDGLKPFVIAGFVDEKIFLPFRTRFGVVTKQDMVEPEPKQFLGGKQWHSGLLGRSIAFSLIAPYASGNKILRRVFSTLSTREDVVKRQIFRMPVLAAILAAISIANIDTGALH